ncbi:virulence factor Mce-like protein [Kibdelosporangium banguiense]|uniref:Virulence factor Mce-like protein n=1 Tax=Kibdelosporangium banguiense TaxID=1365924 RepID=A0ABS4TIL1_9PSEU|nr:MCE family protein [Kibdelosporangium banguiense]MBP2324265.1 virulence factor Mce-like protein [Kibdelosporangium banguiense]
MTIRTQGRLDIARRVAIACVLGLLLAGGLWWVLRTPSGLRVAAYFDKTVGVYSGSAVRVLGVPVGTITDVQPQGELVKVDMLLDNGVQIPAAARAVIVAPSLVSDRYIQLAPAYTSGPVMASGAVISREQTASPVELDDLYASLNKLTTGLGPNGANADGAVSDLLDSLSGTLKGNGQDLNDTVKQLAAAADTLSNSKDDLFATVDSLGKFTDALAKSDSAVHDFYGRLADVSTFLADDRQEVADALSSLAVALGDVKSFVGENKDLLASNVQKLTGVTKALVDQRAAIAEILDVAPVGATNLINSYDAASGTIGVRADLNEFTHPPILMVCRLIEQGTPKAVPQTLTDICKKLAPVLDGTLKLPTVAETLQSLQQGTLPPLPVPLLEVMRK